ncbi:MAG TPA: hypothetical protein VGR05_07970, partial [Sphingomicrobium sp.]|nr:hypothetical protein [Sphingomicrobium sp.]
MNMFHKMLVGSAGLAMIVGAAAPAAAQNYGYPSQQYGNQGGVVGAIINGVLGGGRYGSYGQGNDRMAVDQCARAAEVRVSGDSRYGAYGAYGQGQYQGQYGQGYNNNRRSNARVVAVTQVTRNNQGLRVAGLIDTGRNFRGQGYGNPGYGNQYPQQGYNNQYPQQGYNQGIDPRFGGWN